MATKSVRVEVEQDTLPRSPEAEREIAELYAQYEQQISAYAHKRTSSANANDVVAETFLTAWRRRDDIPAEPQTLPWLYGVSRRVLANSRRSDTRYQRLRERMTREPADQGTPVNMIESKDAFSEVSAAINALGESDAEVLRLTAWEGLTPTEIAAVLSIEPSAARQRLFRARQRLTEQLDKQAADKERRRLVRATAAAIIAMFVVIAGLFATRFLSDGPTLESDLINQIEEENTRELVDPNIVDENARAGVESGVDTSEVVATDIPEAIPFEEPADESVTTEPVVEEPDPAQPAAESEPAAAPTASASTDLVAPSTEAQFAEPETIPETTIAVPQFEVATGPFVQGQDLFIFQLDFAGLDDAHATVALAEAVSGYGIEPVIVAGTATLDNTNWTPDYQGVMNATWGDDWFDAQTNRPSTVAQVADLWLATLDAGGHVWIAEGGVSDFTADVLREVQAQRPDLDTTDVVHVVHHHPRNIGQTVTANMELVRAQTDFTRIDDGNLVNDTADLEQPANGFEAAALQGEFASGWTAAFELMPSGQLDFSDAVTGLYLLGVGTDVVATTADFQQQFLQ